MRIEKSQDSKREVSRPAGRVLVFPLIVFAIYGVVFLLMPEQALAALKNSGKVLLHILLPLALVFVVMLVLNLCVAPARIVRFLGSGAGIKGILLSVVGGIASMGPIYVWYPFLKELREKGMGSMPIAVFLYNRAVKPFLLPVMVSYFGWLFVAILTILTVLASVANGYLVAMLAKGSLTNHR